MPTAVIMPKFEMAQESGVVGRWLVQEGAAVAKGDVILEVETDKVTMDVEATADGRLAGICAAPGQVVPIGQTIAYILKAGESLPEAGPQASAKNGRSDDEERHRVPGDLRSQRNSVSTPVAARVAAAHGVDLAGVTGSGPHGRVTRNDVETHLITRSPATGGGKIQAVPAARRLARELGVDLSAISGSGPDGRVQSDDVQRAAEAMRAAPVSAVAPASPAPAVPAAPAGAPPVARTVPLSSIRRTIAERMTASVTTVPQFTVSLDADMSRALELVEDVRAGAAAAGVATAAGADAPKVTLTALLVKACAWALLRRPEVNASFAGDSIIEWGEINIGVAAAVEGGLVVPVLRGADRLRLFEIAQGLADLGARARAGRLRLEDLQGGTFTISNLGMFGIERFTAIVNPPQAAILAVGKVSRRAVVLEDGQIVARPMMTLTLTADHRVLDGAAAAQWLNTLQSALEHPGLLLA